MRRGEERSEGRSEEGESEAFTHSGWTIKLNHEKKKVRGKEEGAMCMREVEGGVRKTGVYALDRYIPFLILFSGSYIAQNEFCQAERQLFH